MEDEIICPYNESGLYTIEDCYDCFFYWDCEEEIHNCLENK